MHPLFFGTNLTDLLFSLHSNDKNPLFEDIGKEKSRY